MRYGSLFAGIGGFDLGLYQAGMECAWQVEKDDYARGVLDYRWPDVPKFDDVTTFERKQTNVPVDLICGGFPCQDLSVAGRRAGLAGKRSGLFHEFMRIAAEFAPRWILLENVPGLLSSDGGRDMAIVTSTLAGLGYGWAYRILNSQFFGLAQRRRRVFIVGYLGVPARAAQVLFERDCLPGHSQPGGKTRQEDSLGVTACLNSGGGHGFRTEPGEHLVVGTLSEHSPRHGHAMTTQQAAEAGHLIAFDTTQITSSGNYSNPQPGDPCHPLAAGANPPALAYTWQSGGDVRHNFNGKSSPTLSVEQVPAVGVRRLTPVECERLQGFPDDWSRWRIQNGRTVEQFDSARYQQLGNAVSVPVATWIAERIANNHLKKET